MLRYITLKDGRRVQAIDLGQIGRGEYLFYYGYSLYVVNTNYKEIDHQDCSDMIDKYAIS